MKSKRVLLICNDYIRANMRGPAIRYWEFAKVLNNYFAVTLAIPPFVSADSSPQELSPTFVVSPCRTSSELKTLTRQADVVVTVGANLSIYPFLVKTTKPLVVDMYIPFMLEDLQKYEARSIHNQIVFYMANRGAHTRQVRSADFIICASEKQKDFWLGWLSALGRVNPYVYRHDPTLAKLIDVVPFGLPRNPPRSRKRVLKGVYKSIAADDKVILWGGGMWDWLDPQTLIKAMSLIARTHPHVRLFFMGTKTSSSAESEAVSNAVKLSQQLDLYDTQIFFNDWVSYEERENYLLEADIGLSLHRNHIETRFSFRTRLLDYFWAGLPVVTTEGDVLSEEVARFRLGRIVKSGDVHQLSQTLVEMLDTPNLRQRYKAGFDRIRDKYEWEAVTQPLVRFCAEPYQATDKPHLSHIPAVADGRPAWLTLPHKIVQSVKIGGIAELGARVREYLRWKLQN